MIPSQPLPLAEEWTDPDAYVEALLSFANSSAIFRHLCGGVHILDFLTREPDLYTSLLPEHWRTFFDHHDVQDILDLLLRDDIRPLLEQSREAAAHGGESSAQWRGAPLPPLDLLEYIHQIRRLSLGRDFTPSQPGTPSIPRKIAVGMNVKKYHEVAHFSKYVDSLCETVDEQRGDPITHIVDFGSGQSYLGRTLACPPYNRHIVAIERKHQFISGAKGMDIHAKLQEKKRINMYNKKLANCKTCAEPDAPAGVDADRQKSANAKEDATKGPSDAAGGGEEDMAMINVFRDISLAPGEIGFAPYRNVPKSATEEEIDPEKPRGKMDYIEHEIKDGYLEPIIKDVIEAAPVEGATEAQDEPKDANVMVISLHSCGNLLHHGVRSLTLNPSVKAIAMIGCCYNLVTERLGPATYKLPILRSMHPRLTKDAVAYDPHGFPMSKRFEDYEHESGTGMKLNITARSMSLQAPYNWSRKDSEDFFTRHFYRSLLQRMLVDRKVVAKPKNPDNLYEESTEPEDAGNPLIVGSLRKSAFVSFSAYANAAVTKLGRDPNFGEKVKAGMADLTEEDFERYVKDYWYAKKNLSVVWSLMAFSAALVEAIIVVDRWQFLREHDSVKDCWVEPVFEYKESPRNLAVIGIKK
ncbi:hypothetical protein AbraIFM66951_002382 [Aspergillus brasiliensis]|uniref:Methyltransferase domain-containing protein n=1 Tax=Aspergillus brasiliensis TaxID=319629 RepID=A0A9W5YQ52_9EURO|nr:hypothetical protein AbraCBS73388_007626 [Aspergillus brasiliensis]GKZ42689.1 hypothetical protein AbraIFM66951_002382 [Aspergillus brasiliensis]